jgi:hypothetical protein
MLRNGQKAYIIVKAFVTRQLQKLNHLLSRRFIKYLKLILQINTYLSS